MSLFKIFRGSSSRLDSQPLHDGYAYFTPDDAGFYIDAEVNSQLKRIQINDFSSKLDRNLGIENANKFLLTDSSGNVVTGPLVTVYTGSGEPSDYLGDDDDIYLDLGGQTE